MQYTLYKYILQYRLQSNFACAIVWSSQAHNRRNNMKLNIESKEEIRCVISDINHAKSELIRQLKKLEALPGTKGASNALGCIIGRIEYWQNKNK
jgi:hypothetical protein